MLEAVNTMNHIRKVLEKTATVYEYEEYEVQFTDGGCLSFALNKPLYAYMLLSRVDSEQLEDFLNMIQDVEYEDLHNLLREVSTKNDMETNR